MKQNLFLEITNLVQKEQLDERVNQGYTENTIWITSGSHGLISQPAIEIILKYAIKNKIRLYFDCEDGKLVLYRVTKKAEE